MSKETSNQSDSRPRGNDVTPAKAGVAEHKQTPRQYSHTQELINNLPYIAMITLGTAVLFVSIRTPLWKWVAPVTYLIYGVAGVFWIILFLCPFCRYYDTRSCPCGYGRIAAKLRKQKSPDLHNRIPQDCFTEKFKKHIPVIVPLWFIPILVGVTLSVSAFSISLLVLLIAFAVDAFVLLPLLSTKHGCKECPQRDSCPWMKGSRRTGTQRQR